MTASAPAPAPIVAAGRGRMIAVAVALVLCACRADQPHRWTDETHGFAVHADFERHLVEPVLRSTLDVKLDSLCGLFGIDEFGELTIHVHDLSGPEIGSARASGYHDSA